MSRVVLIGFDAASWPVIEAEMDAGGLPNLARLRAEGGHGSVALPTGLADTAVWASFSTGLAPDHHGWLYRRVFRPSDYERELFGREQLEAPPFWQAVSDAGRKVVVVDVPFAPLGHDLNGVELADWTTHEEEGHEPVSSPPGFAASVVRRYGPGHVDPCVRLPSTWAGRQRFLDERASMTRRKGDLVVDLIREHDPDLTMAVFNASHCVGHLLWHVHDTDHPRHDPEARARLGDPVVDQYRLVDEQIGRIVEAAGPDATVTVFAGQGIGRAYVDQPWFDDLLHRLDPAVRRDASAHRAARSAWRRLVPHRVRAALPEAWHRRARRTGYHQRAGRSWFGLTSDSTCGLVRLNLAGRERDGTIPADELAATLDDLERRLGAVVDADTGEPVFIGFERMAERWPGPRTDALPDLLVIGRGEPFRAALLPDGGELPGPAPHRLSHHTRPGWFVTAGPALGDHHDHGVIDIADLGVTAAADLMQPRLAEGHAAEQTARP